MDNSPDMVICPNCCHQFVAISVDDQKHRSEQAAEIERLKGPAGRAAVYREDWLRINAERDALRAEIAQYRQEQEEGDRDFAAMTAKRDALLALLREAPEPVLFEDGCWPAYAAWHAKAQERPK